MKPKAAKLETGATVDRLIVALEENREKFKDSKLIGVFSKMQRLGISMKTEYSLPPKDTIGKTFHVQTQLSTPDAI